MATEGVKISEMTELAEIKGTEYIPIVDGSENKKVLTDKFATKEDIPDVSGLATETEVSAKQDKLVSGTNIKTINGNTILGSGDIAIESSGVGEVDPNSDGTGEIFNNYSNNKAKGIFAHAEGNNTIAGTFAYHKGAHAEGCAEAGNIQAINKGTHAEGCGFYGTIIASGWGSHAEGYADKESKITSSGWGSHAEGYSYGKHYGGCGNITASGAGSHAQNVSTTANSYAQTAVGCRNTPEENPSPTSFNAEKIAFVIGNGTGGYEGSAGNAFYVKFNGQTHADGEYSSAGADYAECFEWKDTNPTDEDRVGRFVTIDGDKIRLATATDTYILGIISGAPTVIGDNPMRWQGKYLNDEWGRPIYEDITRTYKRKKKQKDGTIVEEEVTKTTHERKINPAYDPMEKYIPRTERPEWDYVGMMGKLLVKQDGTLVAGSFCKSGADGVATKAESGYYVMKVINENQALVLFR